MTAIETVTFPATFMNETDRKNLALQALQKDGVITELAAQHDVSRKFVRQQKNKANDAIDEAFTDQPAPDDCKKILYHVPVSKGWIMIVVICLMLYARCPFRGIRRFLKVTLDYDISQGSIHNISKFAIEKAEELHAEEDLSDVKLSAHDEKYHYNQPILSGTDIRSLYCYLLKQEDSCDGESWAINLWDLQKKSFSPERVYADKGSGLHAGHQLVMPELPYHRDHFHIIQDLMDLRRYFRNRLKTAVTYLQAQESKFYEAMLKGNDGLHERSLAQAVSEEQQARFLSLSIDTLVNWMHHDVLEKAGPSLETRTDMYNFIVEELKKLELIHPHRIYSVRIMLKNAISLALAFTIVLENKFIVIAKNNQCSINILWKVAELQRCKEGSMKYAVRSLPLHDELGDNFYEVEEAVVEALDSTERTSSMAENLHSRISPYLLIRRQVGNGFLGLLRFFLNHEELERSAKSYREKKTPCQILTGKSHPHWIEMLGLQLFKRAA